MKEIILDLLESYSAAAFFGAFAAGVVTAMSPCSLISVPLMVASAAAGAKELEGRKKAAFTYPFSALFAFGCSLASPLWAFWLVNLTVLCLPAPLLLSWRRLSFASLSLFMLLGFWAS